MNKFKVFFCPASELEAQLNGWIASLAVPREADVPDRFLYGSRVEILQMVQSMDAGVFVCLTVNFREHNFCTPK